MRPAILVGLQTLLIRKTHRRVERTVYYTVCIHGLYLISVLNFSWTANLRHPSTSSRQPILDGKTLKVLTEPTRGAGEGLGHFET